MEILKTYSEFLNEKKKVDEKEKPEPVNTPNGVKPVVQTEEEKSQEPEPNSHKKLA